MTGADNGADDAVKACRCGHPREAHQHYRPGTDCSLCPPGECDRYRPARPRWTTLFHRP